MEEEQYLTEGILIVKQYLLKMEKGNASFISKGSLFFKVLLSAILVLSVAILYKNAPSSFNGAKAVTEKVMKEEFQFATEKWYEKQFENRLYSIRRTRKKKYSQKDYAIPASGKVMQGFQKWPRCICPNSYKCKSGVSK